MTDEQYEAVSRLKAWVRDFGASKQPVFIADLETVLAMADPTESGIAPWCTVSGQNACSCHERDGSHACDYCKSQGVKGHME